jgi:hypothetical protein
MAVDMMAEGSVRERVVRDQKNAVEAQGQARMELQTLKNPSIDVDFTLGPSAAARGQLQFQKNRDKSLREIVKHPFHAMVEVEVETHAGYKIHLWYAHENTTLNAPISGVRILTWSHPGFQLALTERLNDFHDVSDRNYTITGVKPFARARFYQVYPGISGMYEPGGSVGPVLKEERITGLKAVKFDMTTEQVHAFISQMSGTLIVTGAPGSGKTTVAFQRIRFLYDQQGERAESAGDLYFSEEGTRVFLANPNLIEYSRALLEKSLEISKDVVELVPEYIWRYLDDAWKWKGNARPLTRKMPYLESRAREAFFSLCNVSDLYDCWGAYEDQIRERLASAPKADWLSLTAAEGKEPKEHGKQLARKLAGKGEEAPKGGRRKDPSSSPLRMGNLYREVSVEYASLRELLPGKKAREKFDDFFARWLYFVYDPLDALVRYFRKKTYEAGLRIRKGTAGRINEAEVIAQLLREMEERRYGSEQEAWLAWLLRFALPEESAAKDRFGEIPSALAPAPESTYGPWSHVVIDEAQDLSVAEASLLCSFVHSKGALTVSADFHQVVSPVHGMVNAEAIHIGCPVGRDHKPLQFPFTRNMRQTREITHFLRAFYRHNFGEVPKFDANESYSDIKPELQIAPFSEFAKRMKQRWSILQRSGKRWSVAMLQVNEDEDRMHRLRDLLIKEAVPLAPIWSSSSPFDKLVTTSVERIKGLEYDICFIVGLDDVEGHSLEFFLNRAYVALSRASRRLSIFCEDYPEMLKKIDRNLFDVIK